MRAPRRTNASHLALAGALAGALACASHPDPDGRSPTGRGTPTGHPSSATFGQGGGTLVSPDGRLRVTVPEGALSGSAPVSIQPITNEAPGGLGGAWRLSPEGTTFATPVLLTFELGAGAPLGDVVVAVQDRDGYWVHETGVVRDGLAGTLTAATTHFSDWSLVEAPSELDMSGGFSIDSSMGLPVVVSGSGALSFVYSDATTMAYLLSGTAEIPAEIADGATTCSPAPPYAPSQMLRTNVAEVPAGHGVLWWGTSAFWSLGCADATTRLVDVLFDTYGINHLGCTRTPGAEVAGTDRLAGSYTIDCGASGGLVASWSFSTERCGAPCTPPSPACHAGVHDCTTGTAVCVDTGVAPDGSPCTRPDGSAGTCGAGTCI